MIEISVKLVKSIPENTSNVQVSEDLAPMSENLILNTLLGFT